MAEKFLAAARQSGDRDKEASALTDLGVALLRKGDAPRAVQHLEQALEMVRPTGNRAREADVLGNLGLAVLHTRNPQRAVTLLEQQLAYAREAKDRFQEKLALENMGHVASAVGDSQRALSLYDQALAMTRELGDRRQEADLLWYQAIQWAELGQRQEAVTRGQAAIDLLRKMNNPEATFLTDPLHKYRLGDLGALPGATGSGIMPGAPFGGSIVATAWPAPPGPNTQATGPGLLRMGLSAAKSMVRFIGSGLKTVPADVHQKRTQTCGGCEHHTGTRCRVCGCFTNVKAWLPHEACPLGKW
jgi:tetratricopeptide (TPR) repeat protein